MPFGVTHKPLVALANSAICSFFRSIEVFGAENVPEQGPIIFACSHTNMAVDPAVLSTTVPHGHLLHYWVKDSLFKPAIAGVIMRNAGNIAVDRKNKNNQKLYQGTFEAMALGECVGVFPEGTSHTEPHLIALKDGTAWAALEYLQYLHGSKENGGPKKGRKCIIVPVAIGYVDKSKYRSRVAVHYGQAIPMDEYEQDFLNGDEKERKLAVKRLTRKVDTEMKMMSVNAADWDTSFAAQMARELLWEREDSLKLQDYVDVAQTLVDLFTTTSNERISNLRSLLVNYHRLLASSRLTNAALTDLPLPQTLDPTRKVALPSRFSTLWLLVKDTIISLFHLPFFLIPLIVNFPTYVVGTLGARMVEDELETQAMMKMVFGILFSTISVPILFFIVWSIFRQVPLGAGIAAVIVWALQRYHYRLIDENYEAYKRLVAAWRILIGVWVPRNWEMPLPSFLESWTKFAPDPPKIAGLPPATQPEKYKRPVRLPSRVLVRHVLRYRLEAAKELASTLFELESQDAQVNASFWLAERFGGDVLKLSKEDEDLNEWERPLPRGQRGGSEVVSFLRERGARLGAVKNAGHWAAASSGDEGASLRGDGVTSD
ncbi:hypothetical protein BD324DRAFT_6506 [Kockovaella imperatae]|uniref:Phospholipid/glycerol acyltransferase domain-containing protein n=1 Tax=Kockovaella imperatae TaxID=4999 RepID=A0A1Y1USX7_9TREE|nr:hypothetical protein BD324DRAFT_6506 [Kockovaella imperatae]ORX40536.1 hypothetical protein BD324DRAFT_6506 [Kockovaella imperatae]